MNRKLWSLMCVVAVASLLCRVNPALAADPPNFKPTILVIPKNPEEITAYKGQFLETELTYDAGRENPYVEVWVSIDGAPSKKVFDGLSEGRGDVLVEAGKKHRYVLQKSENGRVKELASINATQDWRTTI